MMLHGAERTASARISTVRMNRPNPRQHLFIYIFSRSPRPHRNLRFHASTLRRWEPVKDSAFETIGEAAAYLKLDLKAADMAALATRENWSEDHLQSVSDMFIFMKKQKEEKTVQTLLRMSRLPLREPKIFRFSQVQGKEAEMLQNLSTLAALHGRRNLAFIGPQGVGKTHLAMAFGRACCENGYKAYFLKASELNQKLTDAIKYGHESSTINGLVKPSCLIIDYR